MAAAYFSWSTRYPVATFEYESEPVLTIAPLACIFGGFLLLIIIFFPALTSTYSLDWIQMPFKLNFLRQPGMTVTS